MSLSIAQHSRTRLSTLVSDTWLMKYSSRQEFEDVVKKYKLGTWMIPKKWSLDNVFDFGENCRHEEFPPMNDQYGYRRLPGRFYYTINPT